MYYVFTGTRESERERDNEEPIKELIRKPFF